jgi:hypothetical protein
VKINRLPRAALARNASVLRTPSSVRYCVTSTRPDPLSRALGLAQTHTDVTGGLAYAVRERVAVYGSVGRTISKQDANAANLMVNAGVSVSFQAR